MYPLPRHQESRDRFSEPVIGEMEGFLQGIAPAGDRRYDPHMSPLVTAPPEAPPTPPPPRPGFFAVAWATFLGYVATALLGIPLALLAGEAGLDLTDRSDSVERGVFYRFDGWSWAAEACLGLLAVGLTAAIVGSVLRSRTSWEVSYGWTFLILLVTGYAPVLALTPLYGATGLVSLALAAILLRWRARPSGAEPLTPLGEVPRRLRRPVAIAVAVVGPLMAAYVLAYAATHPLRFDANRVDNAKRVFEHQPGKLVRYTFRLENAGSADVTDLAVVRSEGSPALQVEGTGVAGWPQPSPLPLRPLSSARLEEGDYDNYVTVELRHGRSCPTPVARLDAIWLRYTVLGMEHEQRVPLVRGPAVRCR